MKSNATGTAAASPPRAIATDGTARNPSARKATLAPVARAAGSTHPKELVMIQGADHNDFELTAGNQLVAEVAAFLDNVIVPGSS